MMKDVADMTARLANINLFAGAGAADFLVGSCLSLIDLNWDAILFLHSINALLFSILEMWLAVPWIQ
jgi:hypothetical protein